MSVLVEALSVIVRVDTVSRRYPDGLHGYARDCPNGSFCTDGRLARVGFLSPHDVDFHLGLLEALGFVHLRGGTAIDAVVVEQQEGPLSPCLWLAFGHDREGIAMSWQVDGPPGPMAVPRGWEPDCHHAIVPGTRDRAGRAVRARDRQALLLYGAKWHRAARSSFVLH